MARYRFSKGEYKYFAYPLPGIVDQFRSDRLGVDAGPWATKRIPCGSAVLPSALSFTRAETADPDLIALSGRRFQLLASGPIRGALLPLPDHPFAQSVRQRLWGERTRPGRTATSSAEHTASDRSYAR